MRLGKILFHHNSLRMTQQSDVNSPNFVEILQDLQSHDFLTSFPALWKLPVLKEDDDVDRLKLKINCFLREHLELILAMKDYFYDEMITFALKRALKVPVNQTDMDKTEKLFNRFFIEHEGNIKIIFNYFFDDIKPFLPKHTLVSLTTELCTVNTTIKRGMFTASMLLLKAQGARFITSQLYLTDVVFTKHKSLPKQSTLQTQITSDPMIFLPILGCIFILIAIFGWEIFRVIFYFLLVLMIILFFVYLLKDRIQQ